MAVLIVLSSCRHGAPPWERSELSHKDIERLKQAIQADMKPAQVDPPITQPAAPTLPEKPARPPLPPIFFKPISLSLTEGISLKVVLPEVARQIGIDLQLDPSVDTQLVFTATDQPFLDVVEHVCEMGDLRYRIVGKSLRIEKDKPYTRDYNVQFLNLSRKTEDHISIATDVFSSNQKNPRHTHGDNGSHSSVSMSNENNFWNELEQSLTTQMGGQGTFSLHRQGGIVSVNASHALHKQVESYLSKLKKAVTTQVLIEAKVIEVSLSDDFKTGINWQKILVGSPQDLRFSAPFGSIAQSSRYVNPSDAQNIVTFGGAGKSFSTLLNAIDEFGSSRTLSSPRLTVVNNQTAILKVAQNEVYFRLNYNRQYSTRVDRESYNISSDIQTVPIGLVMSVQPSIDEDTGEIILSLRPTISRLKRSVRDPAVDIANAQAQANGSDTTILPSLVPVVEVREIDSVLRLKDQEIGVLGGLMEMRSTQDRSQIPGIGDAPLFGELFKSRSDSDSIVELVILLKASIVGGLPKPDASDYRLYDHYVDDPRRLT